MDADFRIVHLDIVDDRAQVGAPEGRVAGQHVLAHYIDEHRYPVLGDACFRAHLCDRPVKGSLGDVALSLDGSNPLSEGRVCWIGDAVFDGLIEPAKAGFRV
ncbi:hypothetical protein [uncultured Paracoccus sp.]|uniref:hypothetical protein n=1 Tax=uncultured Paracoccus sp. TaxID=189685 RepID=UPI0026061660|nr:hypothetical protein [uncultured Paracoccus sp.]